jgi:hypothetical protein
MSTFPGELKAKVEARITIPQASPQVELASDASGNVGDTGTLPPIIDVFELVSAHCVHRVGILSTQGTLTRNLGRKRSRLFRPRIPTASS